MTDRAQREREEIRGTRDQMHSGREPAFNTGVMSGGEALKEGDSLLYYTVDACILKCLLSVTVSYTE